MSSTFVSQNVLTFEIAYFARKCVIKRFCSSVSVASDSAYFGQIFLLKNFNLNNVRCGMQYRILKIADYSYIYYK